ncbi:MAG TPA: PEGA domain-containing protein [Polyangiaceae bacterium]|nr:PEGA domain-containing protein [Polyangiaceae bacterium]
MLRAAGCLLCFGLLLPNICWAQTTRGSRERDKAPDTLSPAPSASADASSLGDKQKEAEKLYNKGVRAYSRGHYAQAIEAFRAADALVPSAPLSFNTALAYEKLSDSGQALRCYRDYLRRAPDAENSARVKARVRQLESVLANRGVQQFTILSSPAGASVVIDGVARGVTPFDGELPPGKHQVKLSLAGYQSVQAPLELRDHSVDAEYELQPEIKSPAQAEASTTPSSEASARQADSRKRESIKRETKPPTSKLQPWPWVALGAGGASLLVAGAFELSRRSAESEARDAHTQLEYADALDRVDSRQRAARIFLGVGGALVLTSGALWLIDANASSSASQASGGRAVGNSNSVANSIAGDGEGRPIAARGKPTNRVVTNQIAQLGFDGQQIMLRYGGQW